MIGRLKCWLGIHAGTIECAEGYCWIDCNRCGAKDPIATPEQTQALWDKEGHPELGPLERDSSIDIERIQHSAECQECGYETYEWEKYCHRCGADRWS